MGLSSKQVSGDWDQTPPQSEVAELSKPMSSLSLPLQLQQETEALKCPRCDSTNTKFCYYNNYNKSQPRHFCKSCKRHWTKGGTLRNVPLGDDRKNKRPKISNSKSNAQQINHNTEFPLFNSKKTMSSIVSTWFDGNLFMGTNNGTVNDASVALENIPRTEFPFSSVSSNSFELLNGSLIDPMSCQSVNEYGNIFDSMEESTITTINIPTCPGLSTMDLTNSWNWNEIGVLASVDHLWDEDDEVADLKP